MVGALQGVINDPSRRNCKKPITLVKNSLMVSFVVLSFDLFMVLRFIVVNTVIPFLYHTLGKFQRG